MVLKVPSRIAATFTGIPIVPFGRPMMTLLAPLPLIQVATILTGFLVVSEKSSLPLPVCWVW